MKILILVFLGLFQISFSEKQYAEHLQLDLPKGLVKNIAKEYFAVGPFAMDLTSVLRGLDEPQKGLNASIERYIFQLDAGSITAILNDYADKILANLGNFTHKYGLDPYPIDGFNQGFLTTHLTLENGTLNGIGTIQRNGDVTITFSPTTNLLDMEFPIEFSNLYFKYHFNLILLLIGPSGNVTGKIDHFRMQLGILFDLNTFQAAIKSISTTNTGSISLTFSGKGLDAVIDIVVNIISQFVTTILHPFIVAVIQGIISSVANSIVDTVNSFLDNVLNPSNTTNTTTLLTDFMQENVYKLPIS